MLVGAITFNAILRDDITAPSGVRKQAKQPKVR